jgi:uncharacterized repeat protein (TIGR04138 family)
MQEVSFEEALALIQAKDPRYQREAYLFVREALDHTQKSIVKETRGNLRHVTGQELLAGIRDLALTQFGPMAMTVLDEWGIHSCGDFGEIVFNMVEIGGAPDFGERDIKDLPSFANRLRRHSDALSRWLWKRLSETSRTALTSDTDPEACETVLIKDLNKLIKGPCIYDQKSFAAVSLSDKTRFLLGCRPKGTRLAVLNRWLLDDAFPVELERSPGLLAKTEQDSRADFAHGYDFHDAFRKPFLPRAKRAGACSTSARSAEN